MSEEAMVGEITRRESLGIIAAIPLVGVVSGETQEYCTISALYEYLKENVRAGNVHLIQYQIKNDVPIQLPDDEKCIYIQDGGLFVGFVTIDGNDVVSANYPHAPAYMKSGEQTRFDRSAPDLAKKIANLVNGYIKHVEAANSPYADHVKCFRLLCQYLDHSLVASDFCYNPETLSCMVNCRDTGHAKIIVQVINNAIHISDLGKEVIDCVKVLPFGKEQLAASTVANRMGESGATQPLC